MKSAETKILGLALLIGGLVLIGLGLSLLLRPPQYQATARIQVEHQSGGLPFGDAASTGMAFDPYFIQTTFEVMQSEVVLSNVITTLDLNAKWGVKYNHSTPLTLPQAMAFLKGHLIFAPVRNTKIVTIKAYSDDPKEAADIANAIANSYRDYCIRSYKQMILNGLKMLEDDYQKKEQEIQTWQIHVDDLRQKLGVTNSAGFSTTSISTPLDPMRQLNQQLIEALGDYQQASNQLKDLKAAGAKQSRADLPAMVHDAVLIDLLNKLSKTEQEYESLTNSYPPTNVKVTQTQANLNTLNQQINDRVTSLVAGLENKLKSGQATMASIHHEIEDAKLKYLADGVKNQSYYDAKIKLYQLLDQQRLFKAKIDTVKIDTMIPKTSMVQIVDPAIPPTSPASPNRYLCALLLAIGAVSTLGGWLLLKPSQETTE